MTRRFSPGAWLKRLVFFATWILGWMLVAAFFVGVFNSFGLPRPFPRILDYLFWLLLQMTYALLQLLLMRRFLGLEPHRWLLWTLSGLTVGILCESLWHDFFALNSLFESAQAILIFRRVDFLFLFGIPTIFQYFSLPMHLSRRWLWLLAAVPGLALPTSESNMLVFAVLLSITLQAIAVRHIAARRLLKRPAVDKEPAKQPA